MKKVVIGMVMMMMLTTTLLTIRVIGRNMSHQECTCWHLGKGGSIQVALAADKSLLIVSS